MKIKLLIILIGFFYSTITCASHNYFKKDTIEIKFGNNSKVIILVDNEEDLKQITDYDLNKMLQDLSLSIDSANGEANLIKIQDTTGTQYLQDTTLTIEKEPFDQEFIDELTGYYQVFNTAYFNRIEIANAFEAFIRPGNTAKVIVQGDQGYVNETRVEVDNESLFINLRKSFTGNVKRIRVFISAPDLKAMDLSGATKSNVKGFAVNDLQIEMSGAAKADVLLKSEAVYVNQSGATKLKIAGETDLLEASISGASKLNAEEMLINDAFIESSGAAKAYVDANNLSANENGAGTIRNRSESNYNEDDTTVKNIKVRIGNMEFAADVDDWEQVEDDLENLEDIDDIDDLEERIEKEDYIDDQVPIVKHGLNIDIGMNNYLENGEFPESNGAIYSVKPWGSWYIALNSNHRFHIGGPLFIDWGKGISWYNFKFSEAALRMDVENSELIFYEDTMHNDFVKSKITASYINMSLVPMIDFSRGHKQVKRYSYESFRFTKYKKQGFRIGVGPYFGYRLGSHTKYVYKDGGREKDKDRGSFMLNNWRYGVRIQAGYKALDLFFNYDLNNLFLGEQNPELNAFSFGITL